MKIEKGRDPNLLRIRTGGGCLALFGLPFFLVGVGIGAGALLQEGFGGLGIIPFSLIFTLVGAIMVFGRTGVDVDLRRREVVRWWSLVLRVRERRYPVDSVTGIRILREVRKNKNSTTIVFPLQLDLQEGSQKLVESQDYQQSRRAAETLGLFMNVRVTDASVDPVVVREPAELNECLRDRARRLSERTEAPVPPPDTAVTCRRDLEGLIIEIPPKPGLGAVASFIVFGLIVAFFVFPLGNIVFVADDLSGPVKLIIFVIGGLGFVVLPAGLILRQARRSGKPTRLTVNRDFLRVAPGGGRPVEIPIGELEELLLPPAAEGGIPQLAQLNPRSRSLLVRFLLMQKQQGITARSDRAGISFGEGLPHEDLRYLHALLRNEILG